MFIVNTIANQYGSKPKVVITGNSIAEVITITATGGKKKPAINRKILIMATENLETMISTNVPTKNDIIALGHSRKLNVDMIMLSAETASGKFQVQSVEIMDRIIRNVENDESYRQILESKRIVLEETTSDAISAAASQVVKTVLALSLIHI